MVQLHRVTERNIQLFKEARLRALQDSPSAFGSTYAREVAMDDETWRFWAGDHVATYLAQSDEAPCGIAGVYIDRDDRERAGLISMWVAPAARRKSVGRMLVETTCDWAREKNARAIYLMVTSNNEAAIAFYKRLGFKETGHSEPYPNDPSLIEYEMVLAL
jgi:ribosomal protein S18 acetylase RimI-like enzyme